MQLKNEEAPAAACNSDEGQLVIIYTDEATSRSAKRKLKNVWYEGAHLYRYGAERLDRL